MFRFLVPIILIGTSIAGFMMFTSPFYGQVSAYQAQIKSYNEALNNSITLENQKDTLTKKENTIDPEDMARLQKLLPDNVDNIRLILEIGEIARPYGMTLEDVKYDASKKDNQTPTGTQVIKNATTDQSAINNNYGSMELSFSVAGSYDNFLKFTHDLESNLRIVDITSIDFSSDTNANTNSGAIGGKQTIPSSDLNSTSSYYKYNFKIKTYWLKN